MGADDTRRRILEAAIEVIDGQGEEAVRVIDVAQRAGVSQGMVTYHFGTRHNLVLEAQRERYAVALLGDADATLASLEHITDVESVLAVGRQLTAALLSPERIVRRRARLNALGYAAGDTTAWESIRDSTTDAIDRLTAFFEVLRGRGLLREGIDPRSAATMVAAYSFGLVMSDLDNRPPDSAHLANVIDRFQRSLLDD